MAVEILTGNNRDQETLARKCYAYVVLGQYLERDYQQAVDVALPPLLKAIKNNNCPAVTNINDPTQLQRLLDFEYQRSTTIYYCPGFLIKKGGFERVVAEIEIHVSSYRFKSSILKE